jgi:hypothetical protein
LASIKPPGRRLRRSRRFHHLRWPFRTLTWHFADRMMGANMDKFSQNAGAVVEPEAPSLLVGRDRQNHWIVAETHGLCGGLFIDEASAMRFALEQTNGRPAAVRKAFRAEMIFRR